MTAIRSAPCTACPYRKDAPSGLWSFEEYEKLRPYDNETAAQPFNGFACHATPEHFCNGWAVVHSNRQRGHELIALRFAGVTEVPEAAVPMFSSGNEAADYGQAMIDSPPPKAREVGERLLRKYDHLRRGKAADNMASTEKTARATIDRITAAVENERLSARLVTDLEEEPFSQFDTWADELRELADAIDEAKEEVDNWVNAEGREEKADAKEAALGALERLNQAWNDCSLDVAALADWQPSADES